MTVCTGLHVPRLMLLSKSCGRLRQFRTVVSITHAWVSYRDFTTENWQVCFVYFYFLFFIFYSWKLWCGRRVLHQEFPGNVTTKDLTLCICNIISHHFLYVPGYTASLSVGELSLQCLAGGIWVEKRHEVRFFKGVSFLLFLQHCAASSRLRLARFLLLGWEGWAGCWVVYDSFGYGLKKVWSTIISKRLTAFKKPIRRVYIMLYKKAWCEYMNTQQYKKAWAIFSKDITI